MDGLGWTARLVGRSSIVVRFVGAEGMSGRIDASTTWSAPTPVEVGCRQAASLVTMFARSDTQPSTAFPGASSWSIKPESGAVQAILQQDRLRKLGRQVSNEGAHAGQKPLPTRNQRGQHGIASKPRGQDASQRT